MIKQLQKLELTWIGKGNEAQLEPRILIEDPSKSFGDPKSENMLISGDNLLALKALEQNFTGKIKCIYIDPPYNTGNAFEHYDDGVEHSLWLKLMYERLVILRKLLSNSKTSHKILRPLHTYNYKMTVSKYFIIYINFWATNTKHRATNIFIK